MVTIMTDNNLQDAISEITARAMNEQSFADVPEKIRGLFPQNMGAQEKTAALDQALVYALQAHQPGFPPDGAPGYLPSTASLKDAVLNEIDVMARVDNDADADKAAWQSLKKSLEDAHESDFARGADINCPDDYILALAPVSCGLLLRQKGALPK